MLSILTDELNSAEVSLHDSYHEKTLYNSLVYTVIKVSQKYEPSTNLTLIECELGHKEPKNLNSDGFSSSGKKGVGRFYLNHVFPY